VVWFIVVCTAIAMFIPTRTSIAADEPKTVLILQSFDQNSKPWSEYSKALRQELERRSPWPVIIEEVSVIAARADEQNAETQFVGYLHALFDHRPPDLIVTFGALGGAFVQRHRSELFPAIPMILTTIEAPPSPESHVDRKRHRRGGPTEDTRPIRQHPATAAEHKNHSCGDWQL